MCGIVGFLDRKGHTEHVPLGRTVLNMLSALAGRGPDSSGVALFGRPADNRFVLRIKLGDRGDSHSRAQRITALVDSLGVAGQLSATAYCARLFTDGRTNLENLISSIEALDKEIEVVSAGRSLEVIKQVGSPANLEKTYSVSQLSGTHGLGHTRLSTESRVDLSHSQPFWGHGFPDLAIVHNGHITNYHQLRRRYQQRDVRFYTENDSEIVAVYLAEQLGQGGGLEESLRSMLKDLDGSYSCLVATASEFGFVKDPFALKPLMFAETENFVALANEEIALRSALPGDYSVWEAGVREVRVWHR